MKSKSDLEDILRAARRSAVMFHCQPVYINGKIVRGALPQDCGSLERILDEQSDLTDDFFKEFTGDMLEDWLHRKYSITSPDPMDLHLTPCRDLPAAPAKELAALLQRPFIVVARHYFAPHHILAASECSRRKPCQLFSHIVRRQRRCDLILSPPRRLRCDSDSGRQSSSTHQRLAVWSGRSLLRERRSSTPKSCKRNSLPPWRWMRSRVTKTPLPP